MYGKKTHKTNSQFPLILNWEEIKDTAKQCKNKRTKCPQYEVIRMGKRQVSENKCLSLNPGLS